TQDIEIVRRIILVNSEVLDEDKGRVRGFRLDSGVKGLAHLAKPRIYRSVLIEEHDGARQRLRSCRYRRQGRRQTEHDGRHNATRSVARPSGRSPHDGHLRERTTFRGCSHAAPRLAVDPCYLLQRKAPTHHKRGRREEHDILPAREAGWGSEGATP